MTIRVTAELEDRLGRLAQTMRCRRSILAVKAYVTRELLIVEGIRRRMGEMAAGRVSSRAAVMACSDPA